mgnify:CR=1 FL=1
MRLILKKFNQQLSMTFECIGNFAQIWLNRVYRCFRVWVSLILIKGSLKVSKQPWATETASAHNNAVYAGLTHHSNSVGSTPDVAVSENLNIWQ